MSKICRTAARGALLIGFATLASASEPALSPAETAVVARQIATLKAATDRQVAEGWSNTKKVAELISRPTALPVVEEEQTKGVDKLLSGTDDPSYTDFGKRSEQLTDRQAIPLSARLASISLSPGTLITGSRGRSRGPRQAPPLGSPRFLGSERIDVTCTSLRSRRGRAGPLPLLQLSTSLHRFPE